MKDELLTTKIAGAVLSIALLFFGLPILVDAFAGGGGHHGSDHHGDVNPENPLRLAYPIELKFDGVAVVEKVKIDLGTLLATASASRGQRAAAVCKSCHTLDKGGISGTGPNLWDVVGRDVAGAGSFGYTAALKDFGGAWTYDRLDQYLANSKAYIPGTEMAQKIKKDGKRADLLAYLQSLSDSPVDFPAPAPMVEEVAAATDAEEAPEPAAH